MNAVYSAETVARAELELRRRRSSAAADNVYESARNTLIGFTRFTYPVYQPDPIHNLIAAELEAVQRGETKRLIINAPPQMGKSEITSVRFPAWWLGKRPGDSIIISSYGANLAEDKSKQVRQIIESDEYRQLFPGIDLRADTRASDMWRLALPHRGGIKAVGVGSGVTGFGAELGIIDDPVKDWYDGQSATNLEKILRWFKGTFLPRLREDAAIIVIMTRWNINDLTGSLLKQGGWKLLRIPAIAESDAERAKNNKFLGLPEGLSDPLRRKSGESAAPSRFKAETLLKTQIEVGEIVWAGEYSQVPRAAEGGLFKRERFNVIDQEPANIIKRARYWDLALSEKETADYTVGCLVGLTSDRRIVVLDVKRYRIEWDEAEAKLTKEIPFDGTHTEHGIEGAFYHVRAVSKLLRRPELHGYAIRAITPDKDKYTRALPFAARVGAGVVDVLRRGWTDAFIEELCAFPNGANDDQVDGADGAYLMLESNQKLTVEMKRYA